MLANPIPEIEMDYCLEGTVMGYSCKGHVDPKVFIGALRAQHDQPAAESEVEHTYLRFLASQGVSTR